MPGVANAPIREEWLSLGEAAQLLGVHPATLRLWADQGEIPSQRTPGGHRRFRRPDVESRTTVGAPHRGDLEAELVVQSALGRARLDAGGGRLTSEPWFERLDEEARQQHRRLGREVSELLLRYLAGGGDEVLPAARRVGRSYGFEARKRNLGLTDAVRAFLYFRDVLTDSAVQMLAAAGARTPAEWAERFRRVNAFTNEVLLALVSVYQPDEDGHV